MRSHMLTDRPWLAAGPTLAPPRSDAAAFQPGAWILEDDRSLSIELGRFLYAGER